MSFNVSNVLTQKELDHIVRKSKERINLRFIDESMSTLRERLEWSRSRLRMTEDALERYIEKKFEAMWIEMAKREIEGAEKRLRAQKKRSKPFRRDGRTFTSKKEITYSKRIRYFS